MGFLPDGSEEWGFKGSRRTAGPGATSALTFPSSLPCRGALSTPPLVYSGYEHSSAPHEHFTRCAGTEDRARARGTVREHAALCTGTGRPGL